MAVAVILVLIFSRKSPVKVETYKVTRGEIVEAVSSSGEIAASQKADLTFQGGGRVAWVGIKEGDKVSEWQAIASLDTVALKAAYQQALNTYRSLEAAAQKAEDDVKGHSADESFAQKATRMAAQVARDNAFDAVKAAENALKYGTIYAPFAGVITKANPAFAGVNVLPGTAIYSLVNPKSFYFSVEVSETDIANVKVGQKVNVVLDAFSGHKLEGRVENIGLVSVLTSTGGTAYEVKIFLPKTEGLEYRLGMNGDAEIVVGGVKEAFYVPADAVIEEADGNYVWRVEKRNRVKKVKVEIGATSIDKSEIKSGLAEGETVVVRPPLSLKANSRIKT